jgi:cellulose biosynthesis protein BcsQ
VSFDHTKPLVPILFPDVKTEASIGRLLSCENIDSEVIFKNMTDHERVGYLGYGKCENIQSYAYPTGEKVDDFLMQMRHLFNYTIIDCTADISFRMTAKSLIAADNVLHLITCDVNGLSFFKSQESILLAEQYKYNNYLRFLTINGKFVHDKSAMESALVWVDGVIPYCENIPEMWNQGKALCINSDGNYGGMISAIADEIMEV